MIHGPAPVGVVPAAGRSTRMGTSKPLLAPGGRSFLERTVATLLDGGCGEVLVGVRPGDDAVAREAARVGARVLFPERVEDGPIATIRAALGRLDPTPSAHTIVVLPVDHPAVAADTVRRLVAALRRSGHAYAGGEAKDAHGWASWRARSDRILETFFPLQHGSP